MIESEAYPCGRDDLERASATYRHGDRVTVGPAYMGRGQWSPAGEEGAYHVVRALSHGDYYLCRYSPDGQWDTIINAARLTGELS